MNIKYSRRLITPYGVVLGDTDGDIYIEPSTRIPFIYDATKPLTVKMSNRKNFTGGEFDRMMSNFTADTRTISATPVTPPAIPPYMPIGGGIGEAKPCQPRPECMDATPPCSIAVPAGGWCKEEPTPTSNVKKEAIGTDLIAYGVGVLIGSGAGYYIAKRKNKSIIGGIVLGGAVGAGLAWTFLHRIYLLNKLNVIAKSKPSQEAKGKSQYKDIIIPSGSVFNNATIRGFGNVAFKDAPQNQFDTGFRSAKKGEYKILAVVDRSKEDTAPFAQPMNINGFSVKIGTIVNIQLIKNVTNSIPVKLIIMT